MFYLGLQTFKIAAKIIKQRNPAVFNLTVGGLRNMSNTVEGDIYDFC